jgi:site-specific DNA recombinase
MSRDDIAAVVAAFGDLVRVVREAEAADKADVYAQLGMTLTYRPESRLVEATVRPPANMRKGFVSEARLHQIANAC